MTDTTTPMVSTSALGGRELVPCGHTGPFAWVDHTGHLRPITCNRPRHHRGEHGYSSKRQAMKHTWTDDDPRIHTTNLRGPWLTVRRVD